MGKPNEHANKELVVLIKRIKEMISNMFETENIYEAVGRNLAISNQMIRKIKDWRDMYENNPKWKIQKEYENGILKEKQLYTLNYPASIASEIARLVTLELESNITGNNTEELQKIYEKKILKNIKIKTEYAVALGGIVYKPYIIRDNIQVDTYYANEFYPLRFSDNGELLEAVFIDYLYKEKYKYTKLEIHEIENGQVKITNLAYKSNSNSNKLGMNVSLTDVEEWAELEGEIYLDRDKPVFSYFKMPLANQIDMDSDVGISVFSKAEEQFQQADELWTETDIEFKRSRKKRMASVELFKRNEVGEVIGIPDDMQIVYSEAGKPDVFYKEYAPEIRDSAYRNGLEDIKRHIEYNCGLAYGTLSKMEDIAKTATEIKASRQRSYTLIADIQKALEESLIQVIDILVYYYNILNGSQIKEYEVSFDFDDSLVVDNEQEQKTYLLEVQAGIRSIQSYLAKVYDMSEEEIEETMPKDELLEGNPTDDLE